MSITTASHPFMYTIIDSPIGELLLLGDGDALRGLYMQDGRKPATIASHWLHVTGLIILIGEPDHVLIENVAVDLRHQGEGIGRALLDYAETSARALGAAELRLYTNAAMTENLVLYTRLGYQEIDRRTENGFERVFFSKCL